MAVTLADVAARAQVSAATVSRVLNGNYPVAEATRARVLRAVDELEYVVNGPASALAAATSDLVGVLVHDIADPFFGVLAGAVQAEMGRGGEPGRGGEKLAVICSTGGAPARELTYLTLLQRQRAAAVIITGGAVEDPSHAAAVAARVSRLTAAGTRVVLCGRPPVPDAVTLTFDNRGGARRLTEHLLTLGHRRIGYIAGPADRTTTRHRLEGHRAALAAHGVGGHGIPAARVAPVAADGRTDDTDHTDGTGGGTGGDRGPEGFRGDGGRDRGDRAAEDVRGPGTRNGGNDRNGGDDRDRRGRNAPGDGESRCDGCDRAAAHPAASRSGGPGVPEADRLTIFGPYERCAGYDATMELLRRDPGITAVMAANDTVALGVCAALRDQGLRIPQDVSVVGFDDLPFSADAVPALTTVRLPLYEAGARAGRLALGREPLPPGGVAMIRAELMVRASAAPPRPGGLPLTID
ncbi:LacI family DNA-binding transcriptional regulator [Streptomyces pactum]|uniref:LacI family DNA-binding transcriptional regulator n=1 Tax=Streptomyces pactum TaxID=68249 RepID=A0ABS0NIG6_9ACTN|nr:LacI family DNA-binding transcriptional regulator [Streptomyces pactum]MBH5334991.1 LacI family DNA-binding transcriptional regulator [Streptomyces pactum]